ncbi:LamG-like jellyroll fold domain-containing protein [Candidatus Sumerlaeota bacterium]
MALDGAQVLDHAIIEDYAMISGPKVLIKDHARVYDKAVVCGDVTLEGYARVSRTIFNRASQLEWHTFDPSAPPYKFRMTTGAPVRRDGPEERLVVFKDAGLKLQANYAFDRPETALLEDLYQEHMSGAWFGGNGTKTIIYYDGVLYGKPGFEQDGDVHAFTFNGKDQYAEAAGTMADLGAITIDARLKSALGAAQTVFDFGSSVKNSFALKIAPSGQLALIVTRNGATEKVTASKPLRAGQWTSCRVEIDGRTIRLWLDNEQVAETASSFRAAAAFPPGVEKRNFIAATRDQQDFFKGSIDYLRVYFTVYDDFAAAPATPRISSRRIDPDSLERFDRDVADYQARVRQHNEQPGANDISRFYEQWSKRIDDRMAELGSSPEVAKAEQKLKDLERRFEQRKNELRREYDQQPANSERRKKYEELEKKRRERFEELKKANPEFVAARKDADAARAIKHEIEQASRKALEPRLKALHEKRRAVEKKRNEYLEEITKSDPALVKNREEHAEVRKDLSRIDEQTNAARRDQLRARERQLNDAHWRRRDVLIRNEPEWRKLEREMGDLNQGERRMIDGVNGKDSRYAQAQAAERKAQEEERRIERTLWRDGTLVALEQERERFNTRNTREAFITKGTLGMPADIGRLKGELKALREETARAKNPDEYQALLAIAESKGQYRNVIREQQQQAVLPRVAESVGQLKAAAPFQLKPWHTRVDWDGRTRWEKTDQKLSPRMKRWFKRMKPYRDE